MNTKKLRLVVDGTNLIYRNYHVAPNIFHKGMPTGAVAGFFSSLYSLLEKFKPDELVVTFDSRGKNFRHDILPTYKGNREKNPEVQESIEAQTKTVKSLLRAIGIAYVSLKGIEADDIIGTLTEDCITIIVSSDKDFNQLINKRISVYNLNKKQLVTPKNCKELFGIEPKRFKDFLTLDGDKIDGIEGLPSVGEKTAIKLIEAYDNILEIPLDAFPKATRELGLKEIHRLIKRNRILVTIRKDVFDISEVDMGIGPIDRTAAARLCERFGLARLMKKLELN